MTSVKFVLFLCGFLISLSSVLSLKCYDWFCYELSCFKQETRQCDSSGNFQCRRLEFYLSPRENIPPGHVLAASCSTHCDQEEVCSKLSGNVSDCRVTCCNTDLCNDPVPDKDKESGPATMLHKKKLPKKMKEIKKMLEKLEKSHKI